MDSKNVVNFETLVKVCNGNLSEMDSIVLAIKGISERLYESDQFGDSYVLDMLAGRLQEIVREIDDATPHVGVSYAN